MSTYQNILINLLFPIHLYHSTHVSPSYFISVTQPHISINCIVLHLHLLTIVILHLYHLTNIVSIQYIFTFHLHHSTKVSLTLPMFTLLSTSLSPSTPISTTYLQHPPLRTASASLNKTYILNLHRCTSSLFNSFFSSKPHLHSSSP
jgi:hypothetical protein